MGNKDASWHCLQCGLPQFTSHLINSQDVDVTNPYSALTSPDIDLDNINFTPLVRSTPVKSKKRIMATKTKIYKTPNQKNLKTLTIHFQSLRNKTADLEL